MDENLTDYDGLINMYSQHWRSFLAGVPPPALLWFGQRGRYADAPCDTETVTGEGGNEVRCRLLGHRRLEVATLGWNVVGVVVLAFAADATRSVGFAGLGLDSPTPASSPADAVEMDEPGRVAAWNLH